MHSAIWGPKKQQFIIIQLLELCPLTGKLYHTYTHTHSNTLLPPTRSATTLLNLSTAAAWMCFNACTQAEYTWVHMCMWASEPNHSNVLYTQPADAVCSLRAATQSQCQIKPRLFSVGNQDSLHGNKQDGYRVVNPSRPCGVHRLPSEWSYRLANRSAEEKSLLGQLAQQVGPEDGCTVD